MILAVIFRDYLATESQKEKIVKFENYQKNKLNEEARKRYNVDDIFKNTSNLINNADIQNNIQKEVNLIETHKITLLDKILNKIKEFLKNIKR